MFLILQNYLKNWALQLVLVSVVLSGSVASAANHYVFWLHGIGGSGAQSGFMKAALEKHLNAHDPQSKYSVHYFNYPTRNDDNRISYFTDLFTEYLETFFQKNTLTKDDKISVVAHSQGGIIFYEWVRRYCLPSSNYAVETRTFHSSTYRASLKVCEHLNTLTTMGTPLWGSRLANIAWALRTQFGKLPVLKDYGLNQLEDMSIGNSRIFEVRGMLDQVEMQTYLKSINFMAIAGVADLPSLFSPFFPGYKQLDDDLGVSVFSAQPMHYNYNIATKSFEKRNDFAKFHLVDAIHIPQLNTMFGEYLGSTAGILPSHYNSLIDVPKECVSSYEDCKAPTLKYALLNILGENKIKIKQDNLKPTSFAMSIRLKSQVEGLHKKQLQFALKYPQAKTRVSKPLEGYSRLKTKNKDGFILYLTGSNTKESLGNIGIKLFLNRKLIREFSMPVENGMMTFIDDDLTREVTEMVSSLNETEEPTDLEDVSELFCVEEIDPTQTPEQQEIKECSEEIKSQIKLHSKGTP